MPKSLQVGPNPNLISIGSAGVLSLNALVGHVSLALGATNGLTLTPTGPVLTLDLPQDLNVAGSPTFSGMLVSGVSGSPGIVSALTPASGYTYALDVQGPIR